MVASNHLVPKVTKVTKPQLTKILYNLRLMSLMVNAEAHRTYRLMLKNFEWYKTEI